MAALACPAIESRVSCPGLGIKTACDKGIRPEGCYHRFTCGDCAIADRKVYGYKPDPHSPACYKFTLKEAK